MKIAVISDIHGNMDAVNAVMEDINSQECEKLFVLGDYAMAGPNPKDTVEYFIEKSHSADNFMIQGNTDLMIADYNFDIYDELKEKAPIMAEALRDDVNQLDMMEKAFLKSLPIQKEVSFEGVTFLLVHGSPRKNNEDILPNTPMKDIEKMMENVDANVVLCGHTHIPCGFQTFEKKTVVNVGSIGRPFTPEPKACYLIINVENGKYEFQHRFIEYNNQSAYEKLKRRNFWGADVLAKTLIEPQKRHF